MVLHCYNCYKDLNMKENQKLRLKQVKTSADHENTNPNRLHVYSFHESDTWHYDFKPVS